MSLDLIIDIMHTIALVGLGVAYNTVRKSHKKLIAFTKAVARNPAKARKVSFADFKPKDD